MDWPPIMMHCNIVSFPLISLPFGFYPVQDFFFLWFVYSNFSGQQGVGMEEIHDKDDTYICEKLKYGVKGIKQHWMIILFLLDFVNY